MPRLRYSLMMSFWTVPCSFADVGALLLGDGDVERQQPGGGGVDRHRGVHRLERDAVEERPHVADVADRDADLADLAAGQRVVAVVAGLGRQVEGDREAGLAAGEVRAVERVRGGGRRMAGVGAEQPGLVAVVSVIRRSPGRRTRVQLQRKPLILQRSLRVRVNRRMATLAAPRAASKPAMRQLCCIAAAGRKRAAQETCADDYMAAMNHPERRAFTAVHKSGCACARIM